MAGMYGCFKGRNSDGAAMASGSTGLVTNQEPAEVQDDCSGKKKSKFQTFKKLFARKKRKEPQSAGGEEGLKGSQSSDNVSKASESNALTRSDKDKGSGSKISLGSKALSHDSVFVSDSSEANEGLGTSQDSIHGKVKSLQLQLKQAIRLGSPPSLMCVKKTEDAGTMSEDDGLPCSPPDYTPLHSVKSKADRNSSNSLHGIDSDEQLSCGASSRAVSPLLPPGDFSQAASPFACLDNSAAKHKLGLRNKACNKRKPARRLELRAEGDSAVEEELTVSITVADVLEEQDQQTAEAESGDQLKPTAGSEEEEGDENKPQRDSSPFSPGDTEGEDEPEAEPDVSHGPESSCPPEWHLCEEEVCDERCVPSSRTSSRSSSPDAPSVAPEPPAGPGDDRSESESSSGEDDGGQESREEEESSFLDEVLSSLKTSRLTDGELSGVVLELEETEEEEQVMEKDEGQETEGDEMEVNHASGQDVTSVEVEEEVLLHSLQPEEVAVEYGGKSTEDEADEEEEEEEEEIIVERFIQHDDKVAGDEEKESEELEEVKMVPSQTKSQEETEEERSNADEAEEVKEEPETIEEEWENREREGCVEVDEGRERDEAEEEAKREEEETAELSHEEEDGEVLRASSVHWAGEGDDDPTPEKDGRILHRTDEEEAELQDHQTEDEEADQEVEVSPSDVNQSGEDLERGKDEISLLVEVDEAQEEGGASPSPAPMFDESPINSPSKTTTLHINLVSPTSEKTASPFEFRPAAAGPRNGVTESLSPSDATSAADERPEAGTDQEEEGNQNDSAPEVPTSPPDQSKVRFTIAPAWQRLQSPPASPSTAPALQEGGAEAEAAGRPEKDLKAEPGSPAKAELVLSPVRGRSSGSFTSRPQCHAPSSATEAHTAAPARTPEGAAAGEANPDSPFGVRLRKTSALLRLSSEEVNSEVESPTHPPSAKAESPHPVGAKPPASHPVGAKPVPPKKPEVHGDAGVKPKRSPEPCAARGAPAGSDPPSWISMAKQKQKVYKETPLTEITVKKEEPERKPALPPGVREQSSSRPLEPASKVSAEKDSRRTLSAPTPVPPQPLKPPLQKPQVPPAPAKPSPPPDPPRTVPSSLAAASVSLKSSASTTPSAPPRTVPEKPASRAAALPQSEPPWMALAKKKAKAWSEMPQIVQ